MATTTLSNSPLQQFNSLSQMHFVRQIAFMLVIAAGIALSTAIILWSTGSNQTALYMDMSAQDTTEVIAILEQNGTEYKIENGSGIVTVPSDQVQETRLLLASNGLPRSSNRGYGMLEDEVAFGTSNFIEQARYTRALEQELVQTIKKIRGVRDARVHLSVPKQTSFLRSASKASASVMLDLINTQILGDSQLAGIIHLVSSSVAGMEAEDISVVDQRGSLLSKNNDSEFGSSNDNINFTRKMEAELSQRIIEILSPIVGPENVHAQVNAELDFTYIETTEENYNPATASIRSEQTQSERLGDTLTTTVEPGTLAATPPDDTTGQNTEQVQAQGGDENQTRVSSTRNFELDRTINHVRSVPGTINRLSVAVLVDLHPFIPVIPTAIDPDADPDAPASAPDAVVTEIIDPVLDQEKLDRLTQLVQDSIGFDLTRGDSVNVINETFFHAASIAPLPEIAIWQQGWVLPAAKQLGAALVVLYLLFGVLKPAMKSVVSNQSNLPNRGSMAALPAGTATEAGIADDQVSLSDTATALPGATKAPGKSIYDDNLNLAQNLVEQEPARAARMIKDWVAD